LDDHGHQGVLVMAEATAPVGGAQPQGDERSTAALGCLESPRLPAFRGLHTSDRYAITHGLQRVEPAPGDTDPARLSSVRLLGHWIVDSGFRARRQLPAQERSAVETRIEG